MNPLRLPLPCFSMRSFLRLVSFLVIAVACRQDAMAALKLREGDRVVFYGDSITDQRLYTTFTETYLVTRFPKLNIDFVHSGWGGDRVTGGGGGGIDTRLKRDVFTYKPTVMSIMLGMNDASYKAFDQGIFDTYRNGYQHILDSVKKELPGIRLTLIQPSPFDDICQAPKFEGGYNQVLLRYADCVKELAAKESTGLANLNDPVVAVLKTANAADADLSKKIIPDRVHPGPSGHLIMAQQLLLAWGAPALVSAVTLDVAGKKTTQSQGAKVSDLKVGDTITWTQLDEGLPMPVNREDSVFALVLKSSDFDATLNQQTLKVTGLKEGSYQLKIDGSEVSRFSSADLSKGANLATLSTPMSRQAKEVHELTLRHNNLHFDRWRRVEVPMAGYDKPPIQKAVKNLLAAMDEEEAGLVKEQRAKAQPVARKFELIAQ